MPFHSNFPHVFISFLLLLFLFSDCLLNLSFFSSISLFSLFTPFSFTFFVVVLFCFALGFLFCFVLFCLLCFLSFCLFDFITSAHDKPSIVKRYHRHKPNIVKRYHRRQTCSHTSPRRSPTMVTLYDTRFVQCRWWNDSWTVKAVVTWRSSASMIPAPGVSFSVTSACRGVQFADLNGVE